MTNYLEEYQKQKVEHRKHARNQLKEVCQILEPLGITVIEAEYDGCGDSGAIEAITFFSNENEYKGDLPKEKYKSLFSYCSEEPRKVDITEIIDEICCHFIPDGWEINEGSFGILRIDIKNKSINIEHNSRYTEIIISEEEFKL